MIATATRPACDEAAAWAAVCATCAAGTSVEIKRILSWLSKPTGAEGGDDGSAGWAALAAAGGGGGVDVKPLKDSARLSEAITRLPVRAAALTWGVVDTGEAAAGGGGLGLKGGGATECAAPPAGGSV
jgi:hypothetical protein